MGQSIKSLCMKQLFLIALLISLLATGCRDDDDRVTHSNSEPIARTYTNTFLSGSNATANFKGRITDKDGNAVVSAFVQIGSSFATTNQYGFYKISNASVDADFALIKVMANNYFDQYRNLKPRAGNDNVVDIQMIPKVYNYFFEASEGGTVQVESGGIVEFEPNSLVDGEGNPYSGQVIIASTYLDPTDMALPAYMPGSIAAVDRDGNNVAMITYGMIGIEILSSSGEALQIGPDYTAQITFPIADEQMAHAPEIMPLWYFDESTGMWYEEESATKIGNTYTAEVRHFSFWNCDIPIPFVFIEGTLNYEGLGAATLYVKFTRPNGSSAIGHTNAEGYFSGLVPANEELIMSVYSYACGAQTPLYTANVGSYSADVDLGTLEIDGSPMFSSPVFSGTVVDCDGTAMPGIAVMYNAPGSPSSYTLSGADGSFDFGIYCFDSGTLEYTLVDLNNLLLGTTAEQSVNSSTTETYDLGELSFCEVTEIIDFLSYSEGENQFMYPYVLAIDSEACTSVTAYVNLINLQQGQVNFSFFTAIAPSSVGTCSTPTLISYALPDSSIYFGNMNISELIITDVQFFAGAYTLLAGTYTGSVSVTIMDGNNVIDSYSSTASGAFHFAP